MEVLRPLEDLTDELRPDDRAVALDERPVGPPWEGDLRDAGHDQRIDEPDEHGEDEKRDERGNELAAHQRIPSWVMTMSITLIPMNGATMPPSP